MSATKALRSFIRTSLTIFIPQNSSIRVASPAPPRTMEVSYESHCKAASGPRPGLKVARSRSANQDHNLSAYEQDPGVRQVHMKVKDVEKR